MSTLLLLLLLVATCVEALQMCPGPFTPPSSRHPEVDARKSAPSSTPPLINVAVAVGNDVVQTLTTHRMVGVGVGVGDGYCSAVRVNYTNVDFRFLVSQLAGGVVRFSGLGTSTTVIGTDPTACSAVNMSKTQPVPGEKYYCPMKESLPTCLEVSKWKEMMDFASDTGLDVILGLNGCWGRTSPQSTIDWVPMELLINHTASLTPSNMYAFEFGDEITQSILPRQYADDADRLHNVISTAFTGPSTIPGVIIPDEKPDVLTPYLEEVLSNLTVQPTAVSVHLYYDSCAVSGGTSQIVNLTCIEGLDYARVPSVVKTAKKTSVYATEVALGKGNVLTGYEAMFWYAGTIGRLSSLGVIWAGYKDLLSDDGNGLIDSADSSPTAMYWFMLLWNYLVGTEVFQTTLTCSQNNPVCLDNVRSYAYSGKAGGGNVLFIMNYHTSQPFNLSCTWDISATSYDVFQVTPSSDETHPNLNGVPLVYKGGGIAGFPSIIPQILQPHDKIVLPPQSLTFLIRNI